jgi:hypothetical protein
MSDQISVALLTPSASDDFVDSVGINTRLSFTNWPYNLNWNDPNPNENIQELLTDIGIRHLRDRIPNPEFFPKIQYANQRIAELYRDYGITVLTGGDLGSSGPKSVLNPNVIPAEIDWYAKGSIKLDGETFFVRDFLAGVEGPNEYDTHSDPNWVRNLTRFQTRLYNEVRSKSALKDVPVVMPSLVRPQLYNGPLGSFEHISDLGNLHPYPFNQGYFQNPGNNSLYFYLNQVSDVMDTTPIWATETGYLTNNSSRSAINETTVAKYLPRILAENFRTGEIERSYLYQFVSGSDQKEGFGLIEAKEKRVNGKIQYDLEPRPAYYAVDSLLDLLAEATWSTTQRKWIEPSVNLNPVNLSFEDKDSSTRELLLQKSDGDYYLMLWQEVESFNPRAGNFSVKPDDLTVYLPTGARATGLYQYDDDFRLERTNLGGTKRAIDLDVPDSLMILEFSTNGDAQASPTTAQPPKKIVGQVAPDTSQNTNQLLVSQPIPGSNNQAGVFITKDTFDGPYRLEIAGSGPLTDVSVNLISTEALLDVNPTNLEGHDKWQATKFGFSLEAKVYDLSDRVDFQLAPGAEALISVSQNGVTTTQRLYMGENQLPVASAGWILDPDSLRSRPRFTSGKDLGLFVGKNSSRDQVELRWNGDSELHQVDITALAMDPGTTFTPVDIEENRGDDFDFLPNGVDIQAQVVGGFDGVDISAETPNKIGLLYELGGQNQPDTAKIADPFLGSQNAYWLPTSSPYGQPDYNTSQKGGLFLWKDGQDFWNLQASGGGKDRTSKFVGSIISDKAGLVVQSSLLEQDDAVYKPNQKRIEFDLGVMRSGTDNVRFRAAKGADLSLQLRGAGSEKLVHVGEDMLGINALPLDLSGW